MPPPAHSTAQRRVKYGRDEHPPGRILAWGARVTPEGYMKRARLDASEAAGAGAEFRARPIASDICIDIRVTFV